MNIVCRFRPLNDREKTESGSKLCVTFEDRNTCCVQGTDPDTGQFGQVRYNFDRVFDYNARQLDIYNESVLPIIEGVLEGFNGTVLAYGQTSSGKTFTMQGPDIEDKELQGIIPRMVKTVFGKIENASEDIEFTVKVSMIEIYMERVKDLLDPMKTNLKVHEDKVKGIYIQDVTETYVGDEDEVYDIMKVGNENRAIGVTDMNKQSSRSHSIFIMTITQTNNADFSTKTGKLFLVDLAGSEKISKTGAKGQTLDEAKTINKSLTTLGIVIKCLTDGKSTHVPYRDSKLTRILSESLGGNSKTCLIITCSPSIFNESETIGTLRFGKRAKQIKNKPKINKEVSIQELKILLDRAEKDLAEREKRITLLEKIIKSLGGQIPGKSEKEVKELEGKLKELQKQQKIEEQKKADQLFDIEQQTQRFQSEKNDREEIEMLKQKLQQQQQQIYKERQQLEQYRQDTYKEKSDQQQQIKQQKEYEDNDDDLELDENGNVVIFGSNSTETKQPEPNSDALVQDNEELNPILIKKSPQKQLSILVSALKRERYNVYELNTRINVLKKVYQQNAQSIKQLKESNQGIKSQNEKLALYNEKLVEQVAQMQLKCEFLEEQNSLKVRDIQRLEFENQRLKQQTHVMNKEQAAQLVDYQNQISLQKEQEMNQKLQEHIKKERSNYEQEKAIIVQEIKQNRLKIEKLEKQLIESKELRDRLEESLPKDQIDFKNKFINYEKNLEQLTLMYHQIASQNKILSKEKGVQMRKLERKVEYIKELEQNLSITRQQVAELFNQQKKLIGYVQSHAKNKSSQATRNNGEIQVQRFGEDEAEQNADNNRNNFDIMLEKFNMEGPSPRQTSNLLIPGSHNHKSKIIKSIRGGGGGQKNQLNQSIRISGNVQSSLTSKMLDDLDNFNANQDNKPIIEEGQEEENKAE
ncbi:kinesin heavy chain [Stylonychia lemnae]|uniref:Kinesin-like protein n=1 Tax=Stylonychia lemnae TaxID=5949 RepID=A0A078A7F6_STYLE|nr:kinesin heavy chain [Stylonychia lemnae]|eukprot:CDW78179.1 kinesin heavy chain [Stylonychia lemnae]